MKIIFQSAGVDHVNGGHFNIHTFNKFFVDFSLSKLKDDIRLKNSLSLYTHFYMSNRGQHYISTDKLPTHKPNPCENASC